jgi:hypothetical protein
MQSAVATRQVRSSESPQYMVADRVAAPPEYAMHFRERLLMMPHTYVVNDYRQQVLARPLWAKATDVAGAIPAIQFSVTARPPALGLAIALIFWAPALYLRLLTATFSRPKRNVPSFRFI